MDNKICKFHPLAVVFSIFVWCCMLSGCFGFRPEAIIVHPDAPFLIKDIKGSYADVYVYDKSNNRMIRKGWIKMGDKFAGYTLSKYDWEKFIADRSSTNVE